MSYPVSAKKVDPGARTQAVEMKLVNRDQSDRLTTEFGRLLPILADYCGILW
jgi:hypothetical protein